MMMSKMSLELSLPVYPMLLLLLLSFYSNWMVSSSVVATQHLAGTAKLSNTTTLMRCIERERQALLHFKRGLDDNDGILDSWGSPRNEDCCQWRGVKCSKSTGHVISLDLRAAECDDPGDCNGVAGDIGSSLLVLGHLNYLDLSSSNFRFNPIPNFIGSLVSLTYLNLSNAHLSGEIPLQLKNLSNLQTLDLGGYYNFLQAKSLAWASSLSSLKTLDLRWAALTDATDWVHVINSLSSLTYLNLKNCSLPNPSPLWQVNLSFLTYLDLSSNYLQAPIPESVVNLSSLSYLDLSMNQLYGPIPEGIGYLRSLSYLDLSDNQLIGDIPYSFGNLESIERLYLSTNNLTGDLPSIFRFWGLSLDHHYPYNPLSDFKRFPSLIELDLSYNLLNGSFPSLLNKHSSLESLHLQNNKITGSIPEDLGQLWNLQDLDLSSNFFNGTITESHLFNLSNLIILDLSFNKLLSLNISSDWTPPFQLHWLSLDSCRLGPHFPNWLQTQHHLFGLSISDVGISDTLPEWFWGIFSFINDAQPFVNISHNQICGALPDSWSQNFDFEVLDLSYNCLEGSVPSSLTQVEFLDISNNKLSGSISSWALNGHIAALEYLDLTNNNLSGELPDCWMNITELKVLNLGNNNFSGTIPNSFRNLTLLEVLDLNSNKLSGEVPHSLKDCTSLRILDLSENLLSGQVPHWFGKNLVTLNILILRQNEFSGTLPSDICHLYSIQILDLSQNNITGTIPNCLYNSACLSGEVNSPKTVHYLNCSSWTDIHDEGGWMEGHRVVRGKVDIHANLVWKGSRREYWKNLALLQTVDLSSNKLTGEIPYEISRLVGLQSLNLSRNCLVGHIPPNLGQLKNLDSLDLSRNQLSGEIPTSIANLNFLGTLCLSYNNLSGKIPSGTQLQSFPESTYMGNPDLCGLPLLKKCEPIQNNHHSGEEVEDQDDQLLSLGLYISIGLGFITGFCGACTTLLLKRSWRHAYFRFYSQLYDKIYVSVVVYIARPIARFQA